MPADTFMAICAELLIDPAIALESEAVRELLRKPCTESELRALLEEEF